MCFAKASGTGSPERCFRFLEFSAVVHGNDCVSGTKNGGFDGDIIGISLGYHWDIMPYNAI